MRLRSMQLLVQQTGLVVPGGDRKVEPVSTMPAPAAWAVRTARHGLGVW
jgi:hypothetical protein